MSDETTTHDPGNLGITLKGLAVAHALLILLQAALAGRYLEDGASLTLHQSIGTSVLYPVAIGQGILAWVLWRRNQLTFSYPLLCVAVVVVEGVQIGFGFTGQVALHVFIGVALFGAAVMLVAMSHPPRRPEALEEPPNEVEPGTFGEPSN